MASIALSDQNVRRAAAVRPDDRHGWGFAALLCVVATLFLRPADLFARFDDWPIYQTLILLCLAVSLRPTLGQLSHAQLRRQPVTVALLLLLVAVAASHLAHGFFWGARHSAWEVAKVVALYLLVIGLLSTPRRLTFFVRALTLVITVMATLALLDRYEYISLASLEPIEDHAASSGDDPTTIARLRGTGIFHDPNDLGLVVVPGIVFSAFLLTRPGVGWPRYIWLIPIAVLLIALGQTHSRGAFLALAATIPAFAFCLKGWKLAIAGSLAAVPVLAVLFAGRMTEFTALHEGTGQSRLQIWSDNLVVFRRHPLFGLGEGMLVEEFGVVSHNSFLQCFAELGLFGGAAFLAAFLVVILGTAPAAQDRGGGRDEPRAGEVRWLRPFVFTAVVGYAAGLLTLSRQFIAPTYLMLGLAVATHSLQGRPWPAPWRNGVSGPAVVLAASLLFLASTYLTVRLLVRW